MDTTTDLLEIYTFGSVVILWQQTRTVMSLSPREEALLIYLAYHSIPISRGQLCDVFWPDESSSRARGNLRKLLTDIRKSMGTFVTTDRESVWLTTGEYWLDVHEFERHIYSLHYLKGGSLTTESDIAHLVKASELYQGVFLETFKQPQSRYFAAWIEEKQLSLQTQAMRAFSHLVKYHIQVGHPLQAIDQAKRLLRFDPLNEEGNEQLIRLLAHQNQLAAALEHYQRYADLVHNELDCEVEAELESLYHQLKSGIVPPLAMGKAVRMSQAMRSNNERSLPIPLPLTPLIGRSVLLNQLHQYLQSSAVRLITLTGLGGIGKTRVALALVDHAKSCFLDGVTYIGLKDNEDRGNGERSHRGRSNEGRGVSIISSSESSSSQTARSAVVRATAQALGIPLDADEGDLFEEQIHGWLRNSNRLLIFDSFECFIDSAPFLIQLLEHAPLLKIIVTSREVLEIPGELVVQVEGLRFAAISDHDTVPEHSDESRQGVVGTHVVDLRDTPSVQLFTSSAERHNPAITFSAECIQQIARICCLVEGNPLAVELAAGLINHYRYSELIAMLEGTPQALDTLRRGRTTNHSSLQSVLEESWRRLSLIEQKTLANLSILPNSFSRDNALQMEGVSPTTLIGLTHKSMVRAIGHGHYRLPRIVQMFVDGKRQQET